MERFLALFKEGELLPREIGRGMHLSFTNAVSLVKEAEYLLEQNPARALSLGVIALEEIGKIFILCEAAAVACTKGSVRWSKVRKKILSHQTKQYVFANYGRNILSRRTPYYESEMPLGLPPLLDKMKQLGFYVDCFDGEFISPEEFGGGNKEWAEWVICAAKERLDSIRSFHESEEKSIEFALDTGVIASAVLKSKEDFVVALREIAERWKSETER